MKILVCRDGCGPLNVEADDGDAGTMIVCPNGHYDPVELDLSVLFHGDSAIAYGPHAGKYPMEVIEAACAAVASTATHGKRQ